jgi:glycosyltransferase involved in cell wall biosynthesis
MSHQPEISLVIPLYNEASHLADSLAVISDKMNTISDDWEFVLVNDGSIDETWDVIKRQIDNYSIQAINFSRNFGKEAAMCAGLEVAKGKAIVTMDGDLQHPVELLSEMIELWRSGEYDIIEARKNQRGNENFINSWGAAFFYYFITRLTGFDLKGASDYKLLDRKVIDVWMRLQERTMFYRGIIAWLGFRHHSISFDVAERAGGESQWSKLKLFKYALDSISIFTAAPLVLVNILGIFFSIIAVIMTLQGLRLYFLGQAVSGFTTVIILQCIIGSFLMFSLGIIGHYLSKIYDEVKQRPRYVIQDTLTSNNDDHE